MPLRRYTLPGFSRALRVSYCALVAASVGAGPAWAQAAQQVSPGEASPPLIFHYLEPRDGTGGFSCANLVAEDFGLHECTAWNPGGLTVSVGIDAEPLGAVSIVGIPLHVVPDVQLEYVDPDSRYQYFTDASGDRIPPDGQVSLRAAIGLDTRFTDRSRWGDGFMLKVGVSCLVTNSVDLNERREGCGRGDLDNWFVKSSFARNMAVAGSVSGFLRAEFWFEMPDHDFATKTVATPRVINSHNDDGQYVVLANAMQYLFFPLERVIPPAEYFDFRLGIGAAHFLQKAQSAVAQPNPAYRKDHNVSTASGEILLSWNPLTELSVTGGARWSKRLIFPDGYTGDRQYWTAQLFAEWRPDFSVF